MKTPQELKKEIIDSMKGIIVDHEARTDDEIVEFYADVFVLICQTYSNQKLDEAAMATNVPFRDRWKQTEVIKERILNLKDHIE